MEGMLSSMLGVVGLLCGSLPVVCHVAEHVHNGPHLGPHGRLHGDFGFVMLRSRFGAAGLVLRPGDSARYGSRIRRGCTRFLVFRVRVALWMLSCGTAQRDLGNAVHEIAGLLFHRLALVILWSTRGTVMAAQNSRPWFLNASSLA